MPDFVYKVLFRFPEEHPTVLTMPEDLLRENIGRNLSSDVDRLARQMSSNGPEAEVAYRVDYSSETLEPPESTRITPAPGDGRLAQLESKLPPPAKYHMYEDTGGGPLERPYQIDIDARHSTINQPETKTRRAMCGNCGARYEITDDPIENHHRAMRHKETCGKADVDQYSEPQRQELLSDFHNQPMQRLFAERAAAEIAAGADPDKLKLTGVSILAPLQTPARPEIAAGPELYPGTVDELIEACTAPRRWWQFWRWFE